MIFLFSSLVFQEQLMRLRLDSVDSYFTSFLTRFSLQSPVDMQSNVD